MSKAIPSMGSQQGRPIGPDNHSALHAKDVLIALPAILIVLAAYVWLVSLGTWTNWPQVSSYYDELAKAFQGGHLWLDRQPDPALLALSNPYDPAMRQDVPILSDASLYGGRYYLYFGPVPAVALLIVKTVYSPAVGDMYLVFAFTCGVFLLMSLLVLALWRRFFGHLSAGTVTLSILLLGLITPFGWILGSRAAVHDAAISAGQFFFLAGLNMVLRALGQDRPSMATAGLAGAFWAAAVGSRITQIVPIGVVGTIVLVFYMVNRDRVAAARDRLQVGLAFGVPLALGFVVLGWYNWARFGSVFETGITYQLAFLYIQDHRHEIFSVQYPLQNLFNYVLMPPKVRYNFPYIWPRMGIRSPIIPGISLPSLYFAEDITGFLYTAPVLFLGFIGVLWRHLRAGKGVQITADGRLLSWVEIALGGAFLASFITFLTFFWASERYLLDFMPAGLLLAVIGVWALLGGSRHLPLRMIAMVILVCSLTLASIVVSGLLSIALNAAAFKQLDPVLWQQLNNVFRP